MKSTKYGLQQFPSCQIGRISEAIEHILRQFKNNVLLTEKELGNLMCIKDRTYYSNRSRDKVSFFVLFSASKLSILTLAWLYCSSWFFSWRFSSFKAWFSFFIVSIWSRKNRAIRPENIIPSLKAVCFSDRTYFLVNCATMLFIFP